MQKYNTFYVASQGPLGVCVNTHLLGNTEIDWLLVFVLTISMVCLVPQNSP